MNAIFIVTRPISSKTIRSVMRKLVANGWSVQIGVGDGDYLLCRLSYLSPAECRPTTRYLGVGG